MSYSYEQEWQRLRADFEARASQYHDLSLSIYYVARGHQAPEARFRQPNHAINLWQHFGHVTAADSCEVLNSPELTRFGLTDALLTAFAVIEGPETDTFRRMAERAGSLIPEEISQRITIEVASRFLNADKEGKPVFVCNPNPLAKWLNLVLVAIATYQPQRFKYETLAVDPFTASLAAFDFVIKQWSRAATDPDAPKRSLGPALLSRESLLKHITRALDLLRLQVESNNALRLCDINIIGEQFFARLLNVVYDLKLANLNATCPNHAAVDLGDKAKRIAIQVTSDGTKKKVRTTLQLFRDHNLHEDYDSLVILIIGRRVGRYDGLQSRAKPRFDPKTDVKGIRELVKDISGLPVATLTAIVEILNEEMATNPFNHLLEPLESTVAADESVAITSKNSNKTATPVKRRRARRP